MKKLEIDLFRYITSNDNAYFPLTKKGWLKSKLEKAGFDLTKEIISIVDSENMKYTYMQED